MYAVDVNIFLRTKVQQKVIAKQFICRYNQI